MILRKAQPGEQAQYMTSTAEPLVIIDCPVCNRNGQQEYLERICGLSAEMRRWTFESTTATDHNGDAYDYGLMLAATPAWFYTLYGAPGRGKTRLLACLVNGGREHGWTSVYTTMAELLDHLRGAYAPNAPVRFDGLWDKILTARILAIDECDRFSPTPWAQEKFFELIDIRYRDGENRCTAFATNSDIDTLDGYLASRMRDRRGRVFQIAGGDWRR